MKYKAIVIMLVCSMLLFPSCQQQKKRVAGSVQSSIVQLGNIEKILVTQPKAKINSGCSNNTQTIKTAAANETYDVVSKVDDWYAVKLPNKKIGFIPTKQCKAITAENRSTSAAPPSAGAPAQGTTAPKVPITNANSSTLSSDEKLMVDLVNQARAQNNVAPLKADLQIANVARVKAQDMIDNNYFSHNSPKYGSPFDMMKSFGVKYIKAGENIAGNQGVQNAFNALMNSPGHRKNILDPGFTNIGIGIRNGGPYGKMFSQMFVGKSE